MSLHILLQNSELWHVFIDDEHQIRKRHCLSCQSHTSASEQDVVVVVVCHDQVRCQIIQSP